MLLCTELQRANAAYSFRLDRKDYTMTGRTVRLLCACAPVRRCAAARTAVLLCVRTPVLYGRTSTYSTEYAVLYTATAMSYLLLWELFRYYVLKIIVRCRLINEKQKKNY